MKATQRHEPKPLTIPASDAMELDRLAQVAREAVANANVAQLKHEAAYCRAVLRAAGIDPNSFDVASQPNGSVVLTPKEKK